MQLLIDEHLSPTLAQRCAERGVVAVPVGHRRLGSTADRVIWQYALDHDFVIVTTNARDFLPLLRHDLHPGLIVLRHGSLSREEQWGRLKRALDYIEQQIEPPTAYMLNRVIEVDEYHLRDRAIGAGS